MLPITHARIHTPERLPSDDSELPALAAIGFVLHANAEGTALACRRDERVPGWSGFTFGSGITFGSSMDPSTMRMLDRVLGTLRFPPLVPGERTGDDHLLVLSFATPLRGKAVIQQPLDNRVFLVVHAAGGLYALALDVASFPDVSRLGVGRRRTRGDVRRHRWSWDGVPLDPTAADPLDTYPVAVGWDGHLLVRTKNTALDLRLLALIAVHLPAP